METFNFILELVAVVTGVVGVWYAKKENILVYPYGVISVVIWVYLCLIGELYGQSIVNFFYFIMNVFGWYNWSRKKEDQSNAVVITKNNAIQNLYTLIAIVVLTNLLYVVLANFQKISEFDFVIALESLITAMNFVSMWLMAWKKLENWLLWIIADIMCIPLFFDKAYYISVVQFTVFIIIAVLRYIEWKKQLVRS